MFKRILRFYMDGFGSMRLGRTLWKIVLLKLLVIFAVFKVFFFPNELKARYDNDHERAEHVLQNLTRAEASASSPETKKFTTVDNHWSTDPQMEVARD